MKSTNRQFHFKLNPAKNYLKMCLLNWIIISIVTLTHSLPIPTTLSSAIEKYPRYRDTLLNSTAVPSLNECTGVGHKGIKKMLCGSYFEMIEKLDQQHISSLTTADDFNQQMKRYDQVGIQNFCPKFPGYIPNDTIAYPLSHKLYEQLKPYCLGLCLDEDNFEIGKVEPMCRALAIGFQMSNLNGADELKPIIPATNSTAKPLTEASQSLGNEQPDMSSILKPASGNDKQEKDKPVVNVPIIANAIDAIKQVVAVTDPIAKADEATAHGEKIDGPGEKTAKENSPKVETAADGSQNTKTGESDAKSIDATTLIKANQTPTVKQEQPTSKALNPSENPMPNVETAEKPTVNEEEAPVDAVNIDEDPVKEDDDKASYKVVTEDSDIFVDSDAKDKLINMNEEGDEGDDDESIDQQLGQSVAKSQPVQSPSNNEQLHTEEDPFTDDTDSNFFTYFMCLLLVCVIAYVVYHNKSKMLALMLEGRRSSTNGRSGLSRRKHTAAYRKLDSNLEEAITSSGNGRSTQVIY